MNYFKRKKSKEQGSLLEVLDLSDLSSLLLQARSEPGFYGGLKELLALKKERGALIRLLENRVSPLYSNFELMYVYMMILDETFRSRAGTDALLANLVGFFFYMMDTSTDFEPFEGFVDRVPASIESLDDMFTKAINVKKTIQRTTNFVQKFLLAELRVEHIYTQNVVHLAEFARGFRIPDRVSSEIRSEAMKKAPPVEYFLIKTGGIKTKKRYLDTAMSKVATNKDAPMEHLKLAFMLAIDPVLGDISSAIIKEILGTTVGLFLEFLSQRRLERAEYKHIKEQAVISRDIIMDEELSKYLLVIVKSQVLADTSGTRYSEEIGMIIVEAERQIKQGTRPEQFLEFLYSIATANPAVQKIMIEESIVERVFVSVIALLRPIPGIALGLMEAIISANHKRKAFVEQVNQAIDYKSLLSLLKASKDVDSLEKLLCIFRYYVQYGLARPAAVSKILSLLNESVGRRDVETSTVILRSITDIVTRVPSAVPIITDNSGFLIIMNSITIYKTIGVLEEGFLRHSVTLLISVVSSSGSNREIKNDIIEYLDTVFPPITEKNHRLMILLAYDFAFLDPELHSLMGFERPEMTEYMEIGRRILCPKMLDWALRMLFHSVKEFGAGEFAEELVRDLWLKVQLNKYNQKVLQSLESLVSILDELENSIFYEEPSDVYGKELVQVSQYLLQSGNKKMITERILKVISNPTVRDSRFAHLITLLADISKFSAEPPHFEFSSVSSGSKPHMSVRAKMAAERSIDELTLFFHFRFESAKMPAERFRVFKLDLGETVWIELEVEYSNMKLTIRGAKKQPESLVLEDYTFETKKLYFVAITIKSLRIVNLYVNGVHKQLRKFSTRAPATLKAGAQVSASFGPREVKPKGAYKYSIGTFAVLNTLLDREDVFQLYLLPPHEFNYLKPLRENGNLMNRMDNFTHAHYRSLKSNEMFSFMNVNPRRSSGDQYPCISQYERLAKEDTGPANRSPRQEPLVDISEVMLLVDANVDDKHRRIHNLMNFDFFEGKYSHSATYYPSYNISKAIDKHGGLLFVLKLVDRSQDSQSLFSAVKLFTRYVERTNMPRILHEGGEANAYNILVQMLSKKAEGGISVNARTVFFLMVHFGMYPLKTRLSVVRYACGIKEVISSPELWMGMTNEARIMFLDCVIYFSRSKNKNHVYNTTTLEGIGLVPNLLNTIFDLLGVERAFTVLPSLYLFRQILQMIFKQEALEHIRRALLLRTAMKKRSRYKKETSMVTTVIKEVESLFYTLKEDEPRKAAIFSKVFDLHFLHYFCLNSVRPEDVVSAFRLFSISNFDNLMKIRDGNTALFDKIHMVYLPENVRTAYGIHEIISMLMFRISKSKAAVLKPESFADMSIASPYYVIVFFKILFKIQVHGSESHGVYVSKIMRSTMKLVSSSISDKEILRGLSKSSFASSLSDAVLYFIKTRATGPKKAMELPCYRVYTSLAKEILLRNLPNTDQFKEVTEGLFGAKDCQCPELYRENYAKLFDSITSQIIESFSAGGRHVASADDLVKIDRRIVESIRHLSQVFKHLILSDTAVGLEFKFLLYNIELLRALSNAYDPEVIRNNADRGKSGEWGDELKKSMEKRIGEFFDRYASTRLVATIIESLQDALSILMSVSLQEVDSAVALINIVLNNAGYFFSDSLPNRSETLNAVAEFVIWAFALHRKEEPVSSVLRGLWREISQRAPEATIKVGETDIPLSRDLGEWADDIIKSLDVEKFRPPPHSSPWPSAEDSDTEGKDGNSPLKGELDLAQLGYSVNSVYRVHAKELRDSVLSPPRKIRDNGAGAVSKYTTAKELGWLPAFHLYPDCIGNKKGFAYVVFKFLLDCGKQPLYIDDSVETLEPPNIWVESLLVATQDEMYIYSYYRNPLRWSMTLSYLTEVQKLSVESRRWCLQVSRRPRWKGPLLCSFSSQKRLDAVSGLFRVSRSVLESSASPLRSRSSDPSPVCLRACPALRDVPNNSYTVDRLDKIYGPNVFLRHLNGAPYVAFVKVLGRRLLPPLRIQVIGEPDSILVNGDMELLIVTQRGAPGIISIFEFKYPEHGLRIAGVIDSGMKSLDHVASSGNALFLFSENTSEYKIFDVKDRFEMNAGRLDLRGNFSKDSFYARVDPSISRVLLFFGYDILVMTFDGTVECRMRLRESWGNRISCVSLLFEPGCSFLLGHRDGTITRGNYDAAMGEIRIMEKERVIDSSVEFISIFSERIVVGGSGSVSRVIER